MICAALGVDGGLEDHAAYLDEYVKLLKEDRSAIFKAARDAEKIYNAVFDFDPELRAEVEGHLADNAISTADPNAKRQQVVDLKEGVGPDLPELRTDQARSGAGGCSCAAAARGVAAGGPRHRPRRPCQWPRWILKSTLAARTCA